MIRTQITLFEEQMVRLREVARQRNQSIAAVVREAVDRVLDDDEQRHRLARALEAVTESAGRSGSQDVARNHDDYLAEDFGH